MSTAAASWPAMNSPPRLPTPETSSRVAVGACHRLGEPALPIISEIGSVVGDGIEQRVLALVQHATVEPVGRGGEARRP